MTTSSSAVGEDESNRPKIPRENAEDKKAGKTMTHPPLFPARLPVLPQKRGLLGVNFMLPSATTPSAGSLPVYRSTVNSPVVCEGSEPVLRIIKQPPPVWYNQQGGRYSCFDVVIALLWPNKNQDKDLNLDLSLLYESGQYVEDQSIMRIRGGDLTINPSKPAMLNVRINEVSANHMHHRFKIQIQVTELSQRVNKVAVQPVQSNPIKVLSKQAKKYKKPTTSSPQKTVSSKKRKVSPSLNGSDNTISFPSPTIPINSQEIKSIDNSDSKARFTKATDEVVSWANAAVDVLNRLQWTHAGYVTHILLNEETGEKKVHADHSKPIDQCLICKVVYPRSKIIASIKNHENLHLSDCDLSMLLDVRTEDSENLASENSSITYNACNMHETATNHDNDEDSALSTYSSETIFTPVSEVKRPKNGESSEITSATNQYHCENEKKTYQNDHNVINCSMNKNTEFPNLETPSILNSLSALNNVSGWDNFSKWLNFSVSGTGVSLKNKDEEKECIMSLSSLSCDLSLFNQISLAQNNIIDEGKVAAIASTDFRSCGSPAFDSDFNIIGFYILSNGNGEIGSEELNFINCLPNVSEEMKKDVMESLNAWKIERSRGKGKSTILQCIGDMNCETLSQLKENVKSTLIRKGMFWEAK